MVVATFEFENSASDCNIRAQHFLLAKKFIIPQSHHENQPTNSFLCLLLGRRRSSTAFNDHNTGSQGSQHRLHSSGIRRVGGLNESEFKKRDFKYTRASVAIVIVFVICNTPRLVPNVMEIFISMEDFPKVLEMKPIYIFLES